MNKSVERQEPLNYAQTYMLINCPRCGFSQPKDKYCAQCGVDMETYTPAPPPFWKKFLDNTALQLGLVFLIAAGTIFFLYQKQNENLRARVDYLKGSVQISSTNKAVSANASSIDDAATGESMPEASNAANNPTPARALLSNNTPAQAPAATSSDTTSATAINNPAIRIIYAEVNKNTLQSFFEDSQGTGQFMSFKDYSAGILPSVNRRLTNNAGVKVLHREEYNLAVGKNLQWFYGLKDRMNPELEVGMTTFIELDATDGNNYRGNLEIQRSWRENARMGIQRRSFPAIFEIGQQSGFFMSGVMPHRSNLENDDELASINVYRILRSEDFIRGDSEFAIFVELVPKSDK